MKGVYEVDAVVTSSIGARESRLLRHLESVPPGPLDRRPAEHGLDRQELRRPRATCAAGGIDCFWKFDAAADERVADGAAAVELDAGRTAQ